MKMSTQTGRVAVALAMLTAGTAAAQIAGVITTSEGRKIEGVIKWKVREKAYAITAKGGNVELEMSPANISDVQIPRPKELDAAIANMNQGNAAAAIPVLEKLANDYLMLQWDKPATRLLAEAYVASGNADKARQVCEKVIAANPEAAYLGEMAPAYWKALLKSGRVTKVEDLMAKAIKSGDRAASASALIMRGDVILAGGETNENAKKALRDGFLRVITLYKSEKDVQPEALYKAAKCFDKLGQSSRADQMRTALKSEYGSSEWAHKR
jgi:tetratricopeptide (TPR) repeat protein